MNLSKVISYKKKSIVLTPLGLYRGFAISVAGIFVYRAFYFGGYDAGRCTYNRKKGNA